ncbi:MAG: hypothetical protein E7650_04940 [Ruminococcaceae bacterium]|nr:hypothetical protein [Oscillospiraceae bacterium]MBQ2757167.1 hypothetical protein [Clostridia bacterium]
MKFTYLGTSSCEGIPAVFCNCPRCEAARHLGGKNIRTRTQALINDDLLVDLPPDTLYHFHTNRIESHKIKYLLITHSHKDHLYEQELLCRAPIRSKNLDVPLLRVFCAQGAYDKLTAVDLNTDYVQVNLIKPFEPFTLDGYRVTPLPARHSPGDEAVIYLIEGEKTLLYAHDTGYPFDEVFDYLSTKGVRLDMATYDCAYVERYVNDEGTHMGIDNVRRVVKRLTDLGVADEKTLHCINHFAHGGQSLYDDLLDMVKSDGYLVSYDGCAVEL